jgi:hypothetical protein
MTIWLSGEGKQRPVAPACWRNLLERFVWSQKALLIK